MNDYRKRFWDTFEQMQEDFDRFFDHYARARRPAVMAFHPRWSPPCNVYDAGDSLRVLVEIAGIQREALELIIAEAHLTLRGTRPEPEAPRGNYQQMEIAFGEFELTIPLAVAVDADTARAWYENGFLHVIIPKIAVPKPRSITLTVTDQ